MENRFYKWTVSQKGERWLQAGHPWVFANDFTEGFKGTPPGAMIQVVNESGEDVCVGYGNMHSLIAFRRLDRSLLKSPLSQYVVEKLIQAFEYRKKIAMTAASFRLAFAEADALPGLIVDFYSLSNSQQCLSIQITTAGMETIKADLLKILEQFVTELNLQKYSDKTWANTAVILKNDVKIREMEGLKYEVAQILKNIDGVNLESTTIEILSATDKKEKPLQFDVNLLHGQKTGFFLDQYKNIETLLKNLRFEKRSIRVLDLFCYVGQWSAQISRHLKQKGFEVDVTLMDASEDALKFARANVLKEGADVETVKTDIVGKLGEFIFDKFDIVICDPPALIKNKKDTPQGIKAYEKINTNALKLLSEGGYFISCSCSQHLSEQDLFEVLIKSQKKTKLPLYIIAREYQSPDHPMLLQFPQGVYLKSYVLKNS